MTTLSRQIDLSTKISGKATHRTEGQKVGPRLDTNTRELNAHLCQENTLTVYPNSRCTRAAGSSASFLTPSLFVLASLHLCVFAF